MCKIFLVLIGLLLIFQCNSNSVYKKNALKISGFKITEYEHQKNLTSYKQRSDITDTSSSAINRWTEEFIDNSCVTKFAYESEYGNNPDVKKQVENTARIIVTQNRGLLFMELGKNKKAPSQKEIEEAFEKKKKIRRADIIKFENYGTMRSFLRADTVFTSVNDFKKVEQKLQNSKCTIYHDAPIILPWWEYEYFEKDLENLSINQVSRPLIAPWGCYIFWIKDIKDRDKNEYEAERPGFEKFLSDIKEIAIWEAYYTNTIRDAGVEINQEILDKIFAEINKEKTKIYNSEIGSFNELVLFTYKEKKKLIKVSIEEFIEFYNYLLLKKPISDEKIFKDYITELVFQKIAFKKAEKLGVTKNEKFLLDKKNYKNNVVLNKFIDDCIIKKIICSENDLKNFYENNLDNFRDGEIAHVIYMSFGNESDASIASGKLFIHTYKEIADSCGDSTFIKGIKRIDLNHKIAYDSKEFQPDIIENIFRMEDGQVRSPIEKDSEFIVLKKNFETGARLKPFSEVKDEVRRKFIEAKTDSIKKELVSQLKKKYRIKKYF